MPYDNAKAALATAPEATAIVASGQLVALRQCLVVSAHADRREVLRRAAIEGGWLPLVFDNADIAWEESRRSATPLVIVDVHDAVNRPTESARALFERLAREQGRLLAVCGCDDLAPHEEIWARQLGAWLVLPGVVDAHDVTPLFEEAAKTLQRIAAPPAAPAIPHARRGSVRHKTHRRR